MRTGQAADRPLDSATAQLVALRPLDLLGFLFRVVLPTWAKGILLRRRSTVALATKLDLDRKAVRFLQYLRKKYGPGPVRLPNPVRTQLLLLDEADVRRVLAEAPEPFTPASTEKQAALSHFEPLNSLITRGPQRAARRQFHDEVLQSRQPVHDCFRTFFAVIGSEALRLLGDKKAGNELCWPEFSTAWFAAVRRMVLGDGARDDEVLTDELARLRANANWVFFRPVNKPLRESYRARLREYLDAAEPDSLAARIANHSRLSGEQAADQVTQWLFAFDAGATTAFRALALLVADPANLADAAADLATWRSGGAELAYLRAAFMEALRLYPTVPALLRQTTAPTNWNGRVLDRGAGLIIYAPYFHRDPERLAYADCFRPDIWNGRDPADALPLVPFSFGPAACPGRHVVSLIGSAWLAVLLSEATFGLVEPPSLARDGPLPGTLDHFAIRLAIQSSASAAP